MKDILSMPFFDGYEMIKYALHADLEERLYLRWIIGHQFTMGFTEFKQQIGLSNQIVRDDRTAEEILKIVKDIIG